MSEPGQDITDTRCGFIAVIGAPNAGKSTLVNALVGAKVSIVSHKVQTTRMPIRGIAIEDKSQLVFIDTPGIFKPRRRLDRAMVHAAWGGAGDADLVVVLIDAAKGVSEEVEAILGKLKDTKTKPLLALNKIDRVKKEQLLEQAGALNARVPFSATFMISALNGSGVADLKRYLASNVPPGPWHYPADEISDAPLRLMASEITREKIYERLHEELPYQATVETTDWKEKKDGVRIEQTILRGARQPAQHRARQGRQHDQAAVDAVPQGAVRDPGKARAPVPVRQGARRLGGRPRALPRAGTGIPEEIG
jgi:GTP-binding protein Era